MSVSPVWPANSWLNKMMSMIVAFILCTSIGWYPRLFTEDSFECFDLFQDFVSLGSGCTFLFDFFDDCSFLIGEIFGPVLGRRRSIWCVGSVDGSRFFVGEFGQAFLDFGD